MNTNETRLLASNIFSTKSTELPISFVMDEQKCSHVWMQFFSTYHITMGMCTSIVSYSVVQIT